MLRFLRIERPTIVTLRLTWTATSIACCMRWMFDAKDATRILPVRSGDQGLEGLADEALRPRHAGALGVRGVAEQEIDSFVAERGEAADIGLESVDRRVVELPVARVDDAARRRLDHDRDAVRNRVGDADEVDPERADLDHTAGLDLPQRGRVREPVLVELRLDQAERQLRPEHLVAGNLAQEVREPADVILVCVGQHDRLHAAPLQVRHVRQDEVDAEVLVAREREARVHDDEVVAVLVHGHVLADLAEATQRNDPKDPVHRPSVSRWWIKRRRGRAGRGARGTNAPRLVPRRWPRRAAGDGRRRRARGCSAPP